MTAKENYAFTQAWLSDPDLPTPLRVCRDNRQHTPLAAEAVRDLAMFNQDLEVPDDSRLAIVVAQDVQFGVARMYQAWADQSDYAVEVFRDPDDAVAWLRGGSK